MDFRRPEKEESALEIMDAEDITFRSNAEVQPVPNDVAIVSDEEGADKRWELNK